MSGEEAWLCIAPDHPALAGHFPQAPIVPGALLLDEALHSIDPGAARWRISNVKFHRRVQPREALRLQWHQQAGGELHLEIHAAEALVVSASIERCQP
jgi:3-hydroxyacyl-[acyl-carrier-protein] dehydratase